MPHGNYERAEIYVGRFSEDFQAVEAWSRLTNDDRPDLFPDIRVVPGGESKSPTSEAHGSVNNSSGVAKEGEQVTAEGVLVEKTRTPQPSDIAPYTSALAVYRYRVDAMPKSGEPGELLVAHWVIQDERVLRDFRREIGQAYPLTLEIYDGNPKYTGKRVVSDLNEGSETLYVAIPDPS